MSWSELRSFVGRDLDNLLTPDVFTLLLPLNDEE
jgi:hypothetical protein